MSEPFPEIAFVKRWAKRCAFLAVLSGAIYGCSVIPEYEPSAVIEVEPLPPELTFPSPPPLRKPC